MGDKLEVRSIPYTSPDANEILIRNHAGGVNLVDRFLQQIVFFDWLKYPLILGFDVAGEVAAVRANMNTAAALCIVYNVNLFL